MARPRRVDTELVAKAQDLALQANTLEDLRCAQAVLMPALLGTTLEQTAAVLGVGRATVARYQSRLRDRVARPAAAAPQAFGGVPHARPPRLAQGRSGHPTPQERPFCPGGLEKNFLTNWQPC
jgi:hypothetical protein